MTSLLASSTFSLTPLCVGDLTNLPWVAIIAVGGGLVLAGVVASIAIIFGIKHSERRQQMWHETARLALEKGQPLPPLPEDLRPPEKKEECEDDFRSGLISIATGAGIYLFFVAMGLHNLRFIGAIPGLIGVALLLHAILKSLFGSKRNDSTDRS
jgi:hypothetical protein